jgi:GT2 family glycosyltransferase
VSIVIPTRDRLELLRTCVSSLERTIDFDRAELLIVNNASVEEETYAYFRELSKRHYVQIIDYHAPFNYSKINNFGVAHTTGEYLLFLNNDTEAEAAGWLEALLEHAQRPEIGAVGARLLYPGRDRRIQHAGVILGMGGVAGHALKRRRSADSTFYGPNRITNYSAVTAACLMVRRSVFDLVGGFDEEFAVAFNDVDLCLRIGQRGLRIVYTPFATLIHHESMSVGRPEDGRTMDEFEIQRMTSRWGPLLQADPFYNPNLPLNEEDFASVVIQRYEQRTNPASVDRLGKRASNPVWALPGIAMHVLWNEGPQALTHETLRYFRERI